MGTKTIGASDKGALAFRPKIEFVEPLFTDGMEHGKAEVEESPEQIKDKWDGLDRVALALAALAEAAQMIVDNKVGDFHIGLDPNYDGHVVDALKRRFPGAESFDKVSYAQYRECRQALSEAGTAFADGAKITAEKVKEIRKNPLSQESALGFDLDSPKAKFGLMRPELIANNMPVEKPNLEDEKQKLLAKLANMLWKQFIKPIIPLPGLPDKIADETA